MGTWWRRTVDSLRDYIEVYGWADPTHTLPPDWVDRTSDHPQGTVVGDGREEPRHDASDSSLGDRRGLGDHDGRENRRSSAA